MDAMTNLAVVVITKDRAESLERTLRRLAELPERPPVVVVDNASRRTSAPALASDGANFRLVRLPGNFGAAARNLGVRLAGTEYVAFADDDSWWAPGSLSRAAAILSADERIGLIAARLLVGPSRHEDPICHQMERGPFDENLNRRVRGPRAVLGFLACAAVVRARAFLSVGGFPSELIIGGEEQLVAWDLWAADWKAVYAPEVCAIHWPDPNRDPSGRRRLVARNDLWAAWQRLPVRQAAHRTVPVIRSALTDRATRRGLGAAMPGLPMALRRRAVVPAAVAEAQDHL
jgi:GT2 family glycosyltransferase